MNRRSLLRFLPASIAVAIGGAAVVSVPKAARAFGQKALLITTEEGGDFKLPCVGRKRFQPAPSVNAIFFDDGSIWDATLLANGFQDGWRHGPNAVRAADHARWAWQLAHDEPPFNFTHSEPELII